jgi:hypothetical protein
MANYGSIPPVQVTFFLTVQDDCATTVVQTSQVIPNIVFVPLTDVAPMVQTFVPFADSFASIVAMPGVCGSKLYSIVEGYPFI